VLVHSVYFWLKPELSPAGRAAFRKGLESLRAVKTAQQMYVGVPAATAERSVIDKSYDLALTVLFNSVADQNAYQVDPLHQEFLEQFASKWCKVVVYDAE